MIKTTLKIEGMMCGMCESHVNDAIRNAFKVKKVFSSHIRGETVVISELELDESSIRKTVEDLGYKMTKMKSEPYEKRGFLSFFKK